MSRTNAQRLRKQLYRYRTWVSHNDVALHYKYKLFIDNVVIGAKHGHETECEYTARISDYWQQHRLGYNIYAHASKFREEVYMRIYYDMLRYLETARGGYCSTSQHGYLCLTIWLDEFKLSFDPTLAMSWPTDWTMKHCCGVYEADRKAMFPTTPKE